MDLELVPILLAKCQAQLFPPGRGPVLTEFPPNSAPLFSEGQSQPWATYLSPYCMSTNMHCMELELVPIFLAKCQAQLFPLDRGPVLTKSKPRATM